MLCDPCTELMATVLVQHRATQGDQEADDIYVSRHGYYQDVKVTCENGCQLCSLFCKLVVCSGAMDQKTPDTPPLRGACPIKILHRQDTTAPTFELIIGASDPMQVHLELFQPELDITTARLARHVPTSVTRLPAGSTAVSRARTWLEQCRAQHPQCEQKRSVVKLPIRVIDVGSEGDALNPRLKITGLMLGEYATLSHCWGLSKRLTTTRANIERHLTEGFNLNDLPATFCDAILFTRLLRIRYLWIDALCIVQDDIGDWNRHAVLMHSIFGNAVLSIAALDSPDSNAGFLSMRDDHSVVFDIHDTVVGIRKRLLPTGHAINSSILETRAWCFQERLLPPAVLHFGKAQLYWECLGAEASESLYEFGTSSQPTHPFRSLDTVSDHDPGSWHRTWLALVEQYSRRLITRSGDRLPALRGLAEHVKRTIPRSERGSYNYGIWVEHMYTGLLWQRTYDDQKQATGPPGGLDTTARTVSRTFHTEADGNEDRAPSWSWASLNQPVNWTRLSRKMRTFTSLDVKLNMNLPRKDSLLSDTVPRWAVGFEGNVVEGTCRLSTKSGRSHGLAYFEVSEHREDDILCVLDRADEFKFARCCAVYMASYRPSLARTTSPEFSTDDHDGTSCAVENVHTAFLLILEEARSMEYHGKIVYRRTGIGSGPTDVVHQLFAAGELRSFVVY